MPPPLRKLLPLEPELELERELELELELGQRLELELAQLHQPLTLQLSQHLIPCLMPADCAAQGR